MKFFKTLRVWTLIVLLIPLATVPAAAQTTDTVNTKRYVFVLSGSEMPVTGAALHLVISAAKSARKVDVLLMASGLDLGREGVMGVEFAPYGASGQEMLKQALDMGAAVSVCQICLQNTDTDISTMVEGVNKINAYQVFDMLEAADVVLNFGGAVFDMGMNIPAIASEPSFQPEREENVCDPETDIDECM